MLLETRLYSSKLKAQTSCQRLTTLWCTMHIDCSLCKHAKRPITHTLPPSAAPPDLIAWLWSTSDQGSAARQASQVDTFLGFTAGKPSSSRAISCGHMPTCCACACVYMCVWLCVRARVHAYVYGYVLACVRVQVQLRGHWCKHAKHMTHDTLELRGN